MGLLDWVDIPQTDRQTNNLQSKATSLLKRRFKKTRRGKGSKKKAAKQTHHEKNMELYRKQKRERGQMFRDFERLIAE